MIWPDSAIPTANVDQATDKVRLARPDLLQTIQHVNLIRAARGVAEGVCDLDADGYVPEPRLRGAALLSVLLTVDGPGSGLNADLLDDKEGADYLLVDGTRAVESDDAQGWNINKLTTSTNTYQRGFTLHGLNTPAAVAAGYGLSFEAQFANSAGVQTRAGAIGWQWTTAAAGNEDADVVVQSRSNGALIEVLRIKDSRQMECVQISSPAGNPPSGSRWLYATASGFAMKDSGGTETLFGAATGDDHNLLSNLTAGDVHTQYVRTDGSRVFTGNLQLGAFSVLSTDLGADPSAPSAGQVKWYTKGGQLYYRSPSAVVGPIIGGGVTDHGDLDPSSLLDDDHPGYLLRQPTADVVLNDSGGDFDLRWEAVGIADFFRLDAGAGVLAINKTGALSNSNGRVQVAVSGATPGIRVDASGAAAVFATAVAGTCFHGAVSDTGQVGLFQRIAVNQPTTAIVEIQDLGTFGFRAFWVNQTRPNASAARFDVDAGEVFSIDATEVVINQVGGNVDTRIESDTLTHALFVDASADVVNVNGTLTTARFNVTGGALDGIYAGVTTDAKSAITGETTATNSYAIQGRATGTASTSHGIIGESVRGNAGFFLKDLQGESLGTSFGCLNATVNDITDITPALYINTYGTGFIMRASVGGLGGDYHFQLPNDGGVQLSTLAGDPTAPGADHGTIYMKADGAYCRLTDGTVIGPFGTGGGGGIVTSDRGAEMRPDHLEQEVSTAAGQPKTTTTIEAPAGSQLMRVMTRVEATVTGGFNCGTAGDETAFGASLSGTVDATNNTIGTYSAPVPVGDTPMPIELRPAGGGNWPDSNGRIVVTIFFVRFNAATS